MDDERQPSNPAGLDLRHSLVTGGVFNVYLHSQENPTSGDVAGARFSGLDRARGRLPMLEDTVVFEAMLNAVERYPMPKCDPDTRHDAQRMVTDWLCNGNEEIMWLSGAPGVGKSAIVQTVCETLERSAENPVRAVHFFGRGQGRREKLFYFPATVAYQLALANDLYCILLDSTIQSNPHIFTQAFEPQFRKLVLGPTSIGGVPSFQTPIIVVIDGLDEIDNVTDQISLLELILHAARQHGMRFLIASRPEQDIDAFFHRPDVCHHVHHVRLDDATFKTSRDIFIFLKKGFARIRQSRSWFFPQAGLLDSDPWPGTAILRKLTVYSDAQFIFSHLIVESIEADRVTPPHEQLQSILEHTAVKTFSKLDTLYHQILSRCWKGTSSTPDRNKARLMGVLRAIIYWPNTLSIAGIADVLDEETPIVENIIRGPMRCLFKVKDGRQGSHVTLCHKSLRDCVMNRSRAGEFFMGGDESDDPILKGGHVGESSISSDKPDGLFIEILSRPPPSNPRHSFPPHLLIGVLQCIQFSHCMPNTDSTLDDIASNLNVDPDVVRRVLHGPHRALFRHFSPEDANCAFATHTFAEFLADLCRSGRWSIPYSRVTDAVIARMLSIPPPCDLKKSFSRQDLIGVLRVSKIWSSFPLSLPEIASVLGIETHIVINVTSGSRRGLWSAFWGRKELIQAVVRSGFLSDERRSGEFHVSQDSEDAILTSLLSRSPPTHSQESFSRHDLRSILHIILCFESSLTIPEIASILCIDPRVVRNVISGPQLYLFHRQEDGRIHFRPNVDARKFFWDARRSGEFHLSDTDSASLLVPILSLPAPPERFFSRQNLMGVFLATILLGHNHATIDDVASLLAIESSVVLNVVDGPQQPLFCMRKGTAAVFIWSALHHFWFDTSYSSERFCISTGEIDALLIAILSRAPPADDWEPYCQQDLMAVIRTVLTFNGMHYDAIASASGLQIGVAWNVIGGPHRGLFRIRSYDYCIPPATLRSFFYDPHRSGKFYISRDDLDAFLINYLSRPPPVNPKRSYSRQCLMDVIRLLFISLPSTLELIKDLDVASNLNVSLSVVHNVIGGPHRALFKLKGHYKNRDCISCESRVPDFKNFLLDPARSGEFYLGL